MTHGCRHAHVRTAADAGARRSRPAQSYGVPFLAAVTDGEVHAGYSEWIADNNVYKVGSKTFHLYPWANRIFDITGWVTGLLQLPSLSATIPAKDVVFCDKGGKGCVADTTQPAGECINFVTQYGPSPASKTPPPPITDYSTKKARTVGIRRAVSRSCSSSRRSGTPFSRRRGWSLMAPSTCRSRPVAVTTADRVPAGTVTSCVHVFERAHADRHSPLDAGNRRACLRLRHSTPTPPNR